MLTQEKVTKINFASIDLKNSFISIFNKLRLLTPTEADLKLAIAIRESEELRAIAHDACSKDTNYLYVFQDMIEDVYSCRERLVNIIKTSPTTTNQ